MRGREKECIMIEIKDGCIMVLGKRVSRMGLGRRSLRMEPCLWGCLQMGSRMVKGLI